MSIQYKMKSKKLSSLHKLLIYGLVNLLMLGFVFQYLFPILPSLNRFVGIGIIGLYLLRLLSKKRLFLPLEISLYGIFITWGIITGLFVAINQNLLLDKARLLVQLWPLVLAIASIVFWQGKPGFVFLSIIFPAVIIVVYMVITGDYKVMFIQESTSRAASFLPNPNWLGFISFLGIVGLLYFWKKSPSRKMNKIFIVALLFLLTFGIIVSGSRKAFITLLIFIFAWLWFSYREIFFQNIFSFLFLVLVLVGIFFFINYIYTETAMGARLQESVFNPESNIKRLTLYQEGLIIFPNNPILGVGLANFQAYSRYNSFSHSDYIEILVDTGIIGFILYFSIFPILLIKINKLKRIISNQLINYRLGLFQAFLISILIIGFTRTSYDDINTWVVLAAIIGYTYHLLWKMGRLKK